MRKILFSIGIAALLNVFAYAQEPQQDTSLLRIWEAGLPYITQYTPEDYKASVQNWCFIQDDDGIMYVGNTSGILEYDGVSWHLIKLSNNSIVRSFAKDNKGKIYVGGVKEFGFLKTDSTGHMQFQSLLPALDTSYHNFADIWCTLAFNENIYFISYDYIFKWDGNKIKVWKPKNTFGNASLINNQMYVESAGVGIMKLVDDTLQLIPGGDRFQHKKGKIREMLPYPGNKILLIHSLDGLFLYDHQKIIPFEKGSAGLLKDKVVYDAATLPNGDYILVTIGNGAYILNADGYIKQWFNKKRGLISDVIFSVFVDKEGTVWIGTNSGISKVELSSPLRRFNHLDGLVERVEDVSWHLNRLYVGTSKGLFYLSEPSADIENNEDLFQKIPGFQRRIRSLVSTGNDLLVIAQDSIFRVDKDNQSHEIKWDKGVAISALRSELDRTKIYVGSFDGRLSVININHWQVLPRLKIEGEIHSIQENPDGSLWISTQYNGVYKVDWNTTDLRDYTITHCDTTAGLPDMSYNFVYQSKDKTYVTTYNSIFYYDETNHIFKPDTLLLHQYDRDVNAYGYMLSDEAGNIWQTVKAGHDNRIYHAKNGQLEELKYSRRFSDFETYIIYKFKELLLFTGPKGIVVYNQSLDKKPPAPLPVMIRKVLIHHDSLIFAGHKVREDISDVKLPFEGNTLRFVYSLPSYDQPEANQYQYFLEGFDEDWSAWTTETQRDFTNLPEGDYRFRVRGQNVYGQSSEEAVYVFTILPPWYRTWWAYLLYALAFAGFVGWVVQWRSARLRREKEVLENIVKERTQQLEQQAEQLKEMDQMKSRLFANISHEFRTPLTLIKGPVAELVKTRKENLRLSDAQMIDRNADRLLRLVNQLLDLSKLDAGNLELEPEAGDIHQFLRALAAAFSSHAAQRGMTYRIAIPQDALYAFFDHDKLEKIVYNLLSNAFKFTPDGGVVTINASYSNTQLELKVKDSGRGIAPEQLPHIFDRFYQTDSAATREQEGTGIGLALTKELVTLMGGNISVQSESGKGTAFTVTLPLTAMEITEQEVAEKEIFTLHAFEENIVSEKEMPVANGKRKQEVSMVLIVEDNADMRSFIKTQLYEDYEILEAAHGKAGLKIAQQEIPDLIITDLMMPQMDGMELCQQLKTDERTSHIPVIMLTAKAGQEHKIEGLETGADDYLTKPFDRQELQVRVKNLITQRQQLRERFSREVILEPRQIAITSLDEQFLQKVMDLLEKHLSDTAFGMAEMQDALAMSKTQLYRKIKALTDQSPGEFIRNYRLKRAAQILSQQGDNVTQVAYAVGFNNLSYFAKCFKELYGVAPSAYSNQL